jgi:hypothetical protein
MSTLTIKLTNGKTITRRSAGIIQAFRFNLTKTKHAIVFRSTSQRKKQAIADVREEQVASWSIKWKGGASC